ncbi:MAG: DUF2213 domain-containing protein [Polyangiaceae bacterium]|nr:DUF2213 domain-containing protein [Polyangiaceae bacterium]
MAERFERFDASLEKATRLTTGGIRVPAFVARTGIQIYRRADGTEVREYRPPEEVFHADALTSLAATPVTDLHPPSGRVTGRNWKGVAVGQVGDTVRADGDKVAAELVVHDEATVEKIDAGTRREISVGYDVVLDPTPGVTPDGQRYDAVQRRIRANHVALLPRGAGRAGPDVALRLDDKGDEVLELRLDSKETVMKPKIRIDGVDYPLGTEAECQAAAEAMTRYQAKVDGLLASEKTRADQQTARADAAEATLVTTKKTLEEATDPIRIDAAVSARAELVASAQRVLGSAYRADGELDAAGRVSKPRRTDRQVREDVVKKAYPHLVLDGKSDDYVTALYDGVVAAPPGRVDSTSQLRVAIAGTPPRQPHAPAVGGQAATVDRFDAQAAYERHIERSRNGWKQPLTASKDAT